LDWAVGRVDKRTAEKTAEDASGQPGDLLGELVQVGSVDAGIDQGQPGLPCTTTGLLQTHSLCRTRTPSVTCSLCQVYVRREVTTFFGSMLGCGYSL
jgi:hypothetical protein